MGTRGAPSLANIFMAMFETTHLPGHHLQPFLRKHYLDDVLVIWQHRTDELNEWIEYLNNCHPTIKFTVEHLTEVLSFLDVNIHINQDMGRIWTDLYSKPTDSHNYLHYQSTHPAHCKKGLPFSQFLRVRHICSWEEDFCKHSLTLKYHFL